MAIGIETPLGLETRFQVTVDGVSLGDWATCKGLAVDFKLADYNELGNNDFVHGLPQAATYTRITLTRACVGADSKKLQAWLASIKSKPAKSTAVVALHDAWGHEVISWTLQGVLPAKWTGPSLDASSQKVAIETLELYHEGFLE
ncbi:MAG: phage tail protein [Candidatus Dormiibacterota bacterium]